MGSLKNYWKILFRPYLGSMIGISFLAVIVGVSGMATVALGIPLINAATAPASRILSLLTLVCFAAILHSVALFVAQYSSILVAIRAQTEIKLKLFEKIMNASYPFLTAKGRASLLCDVTNPPQAVYLIVDLFGRMMVSLAQALLMIGLMVYLSWMATAAIGFLALVWWWKLKKVWGRMAARLGHEIYELHRQVGQVDVDAIDGIKVIKSHGLEAHQLEKNRQLLERQQKPKRVVDMLTRGVVLLNEGGASVIVIFMGLVAFGFHWINISFSELAAFMFAIRRASPSLGTFNSMYLQFHRELKNVDVIEEILYHTPAEPEGFSTIGAVESLKLKNVSFSYADSGAFALRSACLTMKPGEMTAIVGPSGAGKSTLAHLLLRFYSPSQGMIEVNGTDVSMIRLSDWRRKIGFVAQDVFLFHGTIRENISVWDNSVPESEIHRVAQLAQLYDFIATLPDGYTTMVGDRGLKLSGGQAQRIAIARELLKNPEIFIFDEATSALDNLTEKAIYTAIETLRRQAIVIVIAHRLSTIQSADQIVVLNGGKIEACGRHETLLQEGGVYAKLYQAPGESGTYA